MKIECPNCSQKYEIAKEEIETYRNANVECVGCKENFTVRINDDEISKSESSNQCDLPPLPSEGDRYISFQTMKPDNYIYWSRNETVSGIQHHMDSFLDVFKKSDYIEFSLVPEPDNPYDKNAIQVISSGHVIGYVDKETASALKSSGAYKTAIFYPKSLNINDYGYIYLNYDILVPGKRFSGEPLKSLTVPVIVDNRKKPSQKIKNTKQTSILNYKIKGCLPNIIAAIGILMLLGISIKLVESISISEQSIQALVVAVVVVAVIMLLVINRKMVNKSLQIICPNQNCNFRGTGKRCGGSNGCLLIVLLLLGIVPGIIYFLFFEKSGVQCPKCGMKIR